MDRLVLIPERVLVRLYAPRGRKPPSSASEVSIPERVVRIRRVFLPLSFHDTA
jgi:hypothetical protein